MKPIGALLVCMVVLVPLAAEVRAGWTWRDGEWVYVKQDLPRNDRTLQESKGTVREQADKALGSPRHDERPSQPENLAATSPRRAAKKRAKAEPEKAAEPQQKTEKSETGKPRKTTAVRNASSRPTKAKQPTAGDGTDVAGVRPELRLVEGDGPVFPVSRLVLEYADTGRGLPPLAEVGEAEIVLGRTPEGYVPPREGIPTVTSRLKDLGGDPPPRFFASAILRINEQIVAYFNARGVFGVFVTPHTEDIQQRVLRDEEGKPKGLELIDRRAQGNTVLRIVIFVGRIADVRTVASGDRIPHEERVNHPAHRRILENSPIQAPTVEGEDGRDILQKDLLDRYVLFLSRHPGRRVDVAVSRAKEPGKVTLDYLISESKPWVAYHQTSNTGTKEVGEWRSRFGFLHNQLTGNDDVLSMDYVTSRFNTAHSLALTYEAPFPGNDRIRWDVYGTYMTFNARDVGVPDERFIGEAHSVGGDLFINLIQKRDLFIDFLAGIRWDDYRVVNELVNLKGETQLLTPSVGFRIERATDIQTMQGAVRVEWLEQRIADTDEDDLRRFGRFAPDKDWVVVRWNFYQSCFLEPLLNRKEWENVGTPETSTLAHEVALIFKGHHSLGSRLIPFTQETVGGVYSVRGYPESAVAGDVTYVGSVEYRYHIPRALKPSSAFGPAREPAQVFGRPFRFRPQQVYGRPDWDLIFKTFFDIGKANNFDRLPRPLEDNHLLMGCGLGMELQVLRNFSIRVDYGVALRGIDVRAVDAGDQRLHVVATLSY